MLATLRDIDIESITELAQVLRELRRRHARRTGGAELTYRQLAAATGWSHGIIGEYLTGKVLPPTERFDILVRLLGATPAEQGALATARDRVADLRRPSVPDGAAGLPGPRQLPADVPGFTGRAAALAELDGLLGRAGPTPVAIVVGSPGVGKTSLAIHWGHRTAHRFPDGQLYVNLRGYDPRRPVQPASVLAGFLRGLGLPAALVPSTLAERAACFRTLVADRRVLVLLDNAHTAEQVRPLLPGGASSAVVVTSRDDLAGLVARDGARRVELGVLPGAEAESLLRTLVGARADKDPAGTAALARRCARLPLALRVAAEIAAGQPGLSMAELVADLADERRRLAVLGAAGDPRTAVRAVFSWSYRWLGPAAARAFGLLGRHPGPRFDEYAVAALTGLDRPAAAVVTGELRRAHLVQRAEPGGYQLHDLLRAYAAEQVATDERAALSRLFTYYVETSWSAVDALFPHDRRPVACEPDSAAAVAGVAMPAVGEPAPARHWLDAQRSNLIAAGEHAARHGWPHACVALSQALWRYLEVGGHYQEALALHTSAVAVADKDSPAAATVLVNLGGVHWWLGSYDQALDCYTRALAGYRRAGDRDGEARALARLGTVHERLGDYPAAAGHLRLAREAYRATGNRHGEAAQLLNLGAVLRRIGSYQESVAHQRRAVALFTDLGDRRLEGYARGNLGVVYGLLGRDGEALAQLRTALRICRESADRGGEGSALSGIGALHAKLGDHQRALASLHSALAISREIADRGVEAEILNALGETLRGIGQAGAALERHRTALASTRRTGDRYERARALDGIARALAALGRSGEAAGPARAALELYERLGVPEAADARRFSKELR